MIDNQQQFRIFSRVFMPSRKQFALSRVRERNWNANFRKLDRVLAAMQTRHMRKVITAPSRRGHAISLAPLSLSAGRKRRALMLTMRNSWDD